MLCSILIPTRGRPQRLLKTLESIRETTVNRTEVETVVRYDYDDEETIAAVGEFWKFPNTRCIGGPRPERGWADLNKVYDELAHYAPAAAWLWIMNDDAWFERHGDGPSWDQQLRDIPIPGFIVQPEHSQLGFSKYVNVEGGPFPLVPNGCWKPEWSGFADPIDVKLDELLRGQRGWQTHFLQGFGITHDRDDNATLEAHRAL